MPQIEPGSTEWLKDQVDQFERERTGYKDLEKILERILKDAVKRYAPAAFVQTRTKDPSSFAEKAIRKFYQYRGARYKDPVHEMTDLCAGRVITQSVSEVDLICEYIEAAFVKDPSNSEDTRVRLKPDQFGYMSVHFVVELPSEPNDAVTADDIAIVAAYQSDPRQPLKAEIQVRTLLQHVWADVGHDRIYKSAFDAPAEWKRDLAGMSATLENVDRGLSILIDKADAHKRHHSRYMSRKQAQHELTILGALLNNETDETRRAAQALKIGWLHAAAGRYGEVVQALEPYLDGQDSVNWAIRLEYGFAKCRLGIHDHTSKDFKVGIRYILSVAEGPSTNHGMPPEPDKERLRTNALFLLGELNLTEPDGRREALKRFEAAYRRSPEDPYYLAAYLECVVASWARSDILRVMRPQIEAAIKACQRHVELGIEAPYAQFALGRLWTFLRDYERSLDGYLKAIQMSLSHESWLPETIFERERQFLERTDVDEGDPNDFDVRRRRWIGEVLKAASILRNPGETEASESRMKGIQTPVVIVAGSGNGALESQLAPLEFALSDFSGTIVSGGTNQGAAGLIGAAKNRIASDSICLVGYRPAFVPPGVGLHDSYDKQFATDGNGFSYEEPIQYWLDLVLAGVNPKEVKVFGFGGNEIAQFEYKLALALGASVAFIDVQPNGCAELLSDGDWSHGRLLLLPTAEDGICDRGSLWAFVHEPIIGDLAVPEDKPAVAVEPPGSAGLAAEAIEQAAELVHQRYVSQAVANSSDQRLRKWESLPDFLQESNREQVRNAARLFGACGYGLRLAKGGGISKLQHEVELLAELEHGRWIVERERLGYRFGRRDDQAKTHDCILAWKDHRLKDGVKDYDREAVRAWPEIFEKIGYEVYRLDAS